MNPSDGAKPVAGEIVRRSVLKALGTLAFLAVLFLGGIFIGWAWWAEIGLPLPGGVVHLNLWGAIIGIAAALLSPFMILAVVAMLVIGERLIIGADRLQVVRPSRDGDNVVVQIPYRNIANMACVVEEGVQFVGIDVQKLDDPETFAKDWDFQRSKTTDGWHYVIRGGLQRGVDEIHRMLVEKTRDTSESD